jgi:hypothetical protein
MRIGFGVVPIAVLAMGCGDATTSVIGGQPLFATPVDCTPVASECGTWAHMYGCYFGPQAASGGCAGAGNNCHAASNGMGAMMSGFVCGSNAASCWMGMTTSDNGTNLPNVQPMKIVSGTLTGWSTLYQALYKVNTRPPSTNGSDNMPLSGAFGSAPVTNANWSGFTPDDITCVQTWINAGAPSN